MHLVFDVINRFGQVDPLALGNKPIRPVGSPIGKIGKGLGGFDHVFQAHIKREKGRSRKSNLSRCSGKTINFLLKVFPIRFEFRSVVELGRRRTNVDSTQGKGSP